LTRLAPAMLEAAAFQPSKDCERAPEQPLNRRKARHFFESSHELLLMTRGCLCTLLLRGFASDRIQERHAAPGFEGGAAARRAIYHMMDDILRSNRHGAFKGDLWPSAEHLPLRASPIVLPQVVTRPVPPSHSMTISRITISNTRGCEAASCSVEVFAGSGAVFSKRAPANNVL